MRTIHKFTLKLTDEQTVSMPREADILTVQVQHDRIQMWAVVDDQKAREDVVVYIVGTGCEMPANVGRSDYVGTVKSSGESFVWHVFKAPKAWHSDVEAPK